MKDDERLTHDQAFLISKFGDKVRLDLEVIVAATKRKHGSLIATEALIRTRSAIEGGEVLKNPCGFYRYMVKTLT